MKRILQFIAFLIDIILPRSIVETTSLETFKKETKTATLSHEIYPHMNASVSFKHPLVRKTVHALKYKASGHAAELLADGMREMVLAECGEHIRSPHDHCLIVPIPRSPDHVREHGANQAELLAHALVHMLASPQIILEKDTLIRTKKTKSQTATDSRAERFQNITGVFAVRDGEKIRGAHIILIDDVITTGATMNEARQMLLDAGAASVVGIAAAH